MRLSFTLGIAAVCLLLAACSPKGKNAYAPEYGSESTVKKTVLNFGVLPYYNPQRLYEDYSPLVNYLSRQMPGYHIDFVASRLYEDFEKRLYNRFFAFAIANPYQALEAMKHGYRVFGMAGNEDDFRGVILVRKDSGIKEVTDLKGKAISFPAPTAVGATMMPLYFLQTHGLDVNRDIERLFVGSQESCIMNVYLGKSAAGTTIALRWNSFSKKHPEIAAELEVKWETPPMINYALLVRDDIPKEVVDKMASLLFGLQTHEEGRKVLSATDITRFEAATAETCKPVADFLEKYRAVVH